MPLKYTITNLYNFLILTGVIILFILLGEYYYVRQGYEPGWYYSGIRVVNIPQIDSVRQVTRITDDSINVVNYIWGDYHLNKQGFISTFDYDSPTLCHLRKRKVMVIGDSFTEGSIPVYDSSFVARLNRIMPYLEFLNFGVGGTDPLNYRLILKKYLPMVKPDLVIIAFCGDNDEMQGDDHLPQSRYPIMWNTNFIWGGIETRLPRSLARKGNEYYPNVDSMYRFLFHHYHINGISPSLISRLMAQTRLTTRLWFLINQSEVKNLYGQGDGSGICYCHQHLKAMKELCNSYGVKMILAYIPPKKNLGYRIKFPYMQQDCYYPVMSAADYDTGDPVDIHWANKGHETFARFLKSIVEKKVFPSS